MGAENAFKDSWPDDQRMGALFCEFRNKNVNPEGWNMKMNEWINAITSISKTNCKVTFTVNELNRLFERKGAHPQCLNTVVSEMESRGFLIQASHLQTKLKNQSWVSWGLDWVIKKPLSWGFSFVQQSIFGSSQASPIEYVHLEALNDLANGIFERFEEKVEKENIKTMLDVKSLYSSCGSFCQDYRSFLLALSYLESSDRVVILKEGENQYLKIKGAINERSTPTETDIGIARLQKTLKQVESEVEKLESEIKSCKDEAKLALRNNNRSKAEALLRKKQRFEKQLTAKLKAAENIESMLDQLETSFTNSDVLSALKAGTTAQKKMAAGGMNIDKVEETVNDIEEAFEEQSEIGDVLSRRIGFGANLNDDELELELDALLELEELDDKTNLKGPETLLPKEVLIDELQLPDVPVDDHPSKQKAPLQL